MKFWGEIWNIWCPILFLWLFALATWICASSVGLGTTTSIPKYSLVEPRAMSRSIALQPAQSGIWVESLPRMKYLMWKIKWNLCWQWLFHLPRLPTKVVFTEKMTSRQDWKWSSSPEWCDPTLYPLLYTCTSVWYPIWTYREVIARYPVQKASTKEFAVLSLQVSRDMEKSIAVHLEDRNLLK